MGFCSVYVTENKNHCVYISVAKSMLHTAQLLLMPQNYQQAVKDDEAEIQGYTFSLGHPQKDQNAFSCSAGMSMRTSTTRFFSEFRKVTSRR